MTGVVMAAAGIGAARITLLGGTIPHDVTDPADALAGYRLEPDGDISLNQNGTGGAYVDSADWIVPKGAAGGDYEARATLNSGSVSSGTTGSWLSLSGTLTWERDRTTIGTSSADLTIEIRRASDGAVLGSSNVILTATVGV